MIVDTIIRVIFLKAIYKTEKYIKVVYEGTLDLADYGWNNK